MDWVRRILSAAGALFQRLALLVLRWSYLRMAYRIRLTAEDGTGIELRCRDAAFEDLLLRHDISCTYKRDVFLSEGTYLGADPRFVPFRWYFRMEVGFPWRRRKSSPGRGLATPGRTAVPGGAGGSGTRADERRQAGHLDGARRDGGMAGGEESGKASPAAPRETPPPLSLEQLAAAREEYMATRSVLSKADGQ